MKPPIISESSLQKQCLTWLRLQYPNWQVHHSPNEGKRSAVTGYRLKSEGMAPGWPDLDIRADNGRCLLIEMKRPGGRLTPAQQARIEALRSLGHRVEVAFSFEEFKALVDSLTTYEHS